MAVYQALREPGDTIMGMELSQGGHLTHGSPVNFSGRLYNFVPYTVDREHESIDMAEVRRLAQETKPKIIVAGATAYPRAIDFAAFGEIAKQSGALLMVDMSHIAGLVAGGVHESPIPRRCSHTTTHKTSRPRGPGLCRSNRRCLEGACSPATRGAALPESLPRRRLREAKSRV